MKKMTGGVLLFVVAFTTSAIYGDQQATDGGPKPVGVSGVKVVVKGKASRQTLTDREGKFTIEALPAGSYTLSFTARRISDLPLWHRSTPDKVIVATSYSIKIEGGKSPVHQDDLNTNKLLHGVDMVVKIGPGAQVRGQVLAADPRKWVWVPKKVDTNIPGHWALEGSEAADRHNIVVNDRWWHYR